MTTAPQRPAAPPGRTYRRRLLTLIVGSLSLAGTVRAQDAAADFKQNCMSCHTIGGGRLTGPDLKNVTQRKDYDWLSKFIRDPRTLIDAGDPYALEIVQQSRNAIMPTLPGMTKARSEALLDLIEAESKLEKSQFIGLQISDRPFTPEDVERGKDLFLGTARLVNGGASCISCHTAHGVGGLGGGTLGPDLTTVFERYEGRKTLATWLSAPATPTMQSLFRTQPLDADEVLAIVAYFQYTLQRAPEDTATARLNFILLGLGATILLLALFDVIWRKRFRSVRRTMVHAHRTENAHG